MLAVVIMTGEANRYSDNGDCSDESAVKVSQLLGLHFYRTQKMDGVRLLNNTMKEVEVMDGEIDNMTTPDVSGRTCDAIVTLTTVIAQLSSIEEMELN